MLHLASRLKPAKHGKATEGFDIGTFRACTYAKALPSGEPWNPPETLLAVVEGWRLYGLNELLSIAIQSFFWAGLAQLMNEGVFPENSEEYEQWFKLTFTSEMLERNLSESFHDALQRTRATAPSLAAWADEDHEVQIGWNLADLGSKLNGEPPRVVSAALDLILALSARVESDGTGYAGFVHHHNYLAFYPINLDSFHSNVRNSWRNKSLHELLGWPSKDWGVSAHFRVALRKLRFESRDTFKIKPTDEGLEVIDAPIPAFSNPRLVQATQILQDLGALEMALEGLVVSERGKQLLEESVRG